MHGIDDSTIISLNLIWRTFSRMISRISPSFPRYVLKIRDGSVVLVTSKLFLRKEAALGCKHTETKRPVKGPAKMSDLTGTLYNGT